MVFLIKERSCVVVNKGFLVYLRTPYKELNMCVSMVTVTMTTPYSFRAKVALEVLQVKRESRETE